MKRLNATWLILLAAVTLLPQVAEAGPPLICFPFEIGDAASLPWAGGRGWKQPDPDYDRGRLVSDTLSLLSPATPVLVRMETLRRAAIYASPDAGVAQELLARLRERARGGSDALALFDLGYFAEARKQAGGFTRGPDTSPGAGYAHVRKSLSLRGEDAEMEYAAALMTYEGRSKTPWAEHLRKALTGAAEGSLLEKTIDAHARLWGHSVTELRVRMALVKN